MDFGIIVDIETTGLNPKEDKIIEIGIIHFAWEQQTKPFIIGMYSAVEDPKVDIPKEIKNMTGLSERYLVNQTIDWQLVNSYFRCSSLAIAHNAEFDSRFLRARSELENIAIHWACSLKHIDWQAHGFQTGTLNYLAADHGFLNPFAHRALFDCATTFRLISPYMEELINHSYQRSFQFCAMHASYEVKDTLKQRGYRWDSDKRHWNKVIRESNLRDEREFLQKHVYLDHSQHQEILLQNLDWN